MNASIKTIKGIGPKRANSLQKLGIENIEDIFFHFPRRYEDRTKITPIADMRIGEYHTIKGLVLKTSLKRPRWRMRIFEAMIKDDTGFLRVVWFNQPYLQDSVKPGAEVILHGKIGIYKNKIQMTSPDCNIVDDKDPEFFKKILPIYPLAKGISQKVIRAIIESAWNQHKSDFTDFMPLAIRRQFNIIELTEALECIHFPKTTDSLIREAYKRLIFDEFFLLQLAIGVMKKKRIIEKSISHKYTPNLLASYKKLFSFDFTQAQDKVIADIIKDMCSDKPMNRLLQGDVGCGKTVVGAFALALSAYNGYQAVIMAPTEILAQQHFLTISRIMMKLGFRTELLVSGLTKTVKNEILDDIKSNDVNVIVGTHALLQETVDFRNLGLIIIDEQHRFGVEQRAILQKKARNPDVLVMTATPIPRSLALTFYADMDISVMDELPQGRKSIRTFYVSKSRRAAMYDFIKKHLLKKRQAYIVCPLIQHNNKLHLNAVEKIYKYVKDKIFQDFNVGILHGKMNSVEKQDIMRKFKQGQIQVLVSTTVIEVGIDVPNAVIMVIENAERFGLSQLHQLRGRIGRGSTESFCFLLGDLTTQEARTRIEVMLNSSDGFEVAEEDLALRGPGEFFGTRQYGLPELKLANIVRHTEILEQSRNAVKACLSDKIVLSKQEKTILWNEVNRRFKGQMELIHR